MNGVRTLSSRYVMWKWQKNMNNRRQNVFNAKMYNWRHLSLCMEKKKKKELRLQAPTVCTRVKGKQRGLLLCGIPLWSIARHTECATVPEVCAAKERGRWPGSGSVVVLNSRELWCCCIFLSMVTVAGATTKVPAQSQGKICEFVDSDKIIN